MAVDAGDDGPDGRQVDVIVGVDERLVGQAERGVAVRAGGQGCGDGAVGVFGERAADAGSAVAGFFGRSGRFGFWPLAGGRLELSGVLGGVLSLASNSATRAVSV